MVEQRTAIRISVYLLACAAILSLGFLSFKLIDNYLAAQTRKNEAAVMPVAIMRARQECLKEGQVGSVCASITAMVTTDECDGKTCWIAYVKARGGQFAASVIVVERSGKYIAVNYLRDTGTQ